MFDETQEAFVELKKILAENTSPVYAWIGAGLSTDAGLPSWRTLREQMVSMSRVFIGRQEESLNTVHKLKLLDVAELEENLWKAFDWISDAVGPSAYEQILVSIFQGAAKCKIPMNYKKIFDLNIRGVVTTNIDRLATRAYWDSKLGAKDGRTLKEFMGLDCKSYAYVLASMDFFILHLHGYYENSASLVMRSKDIETLSENRWYKNFIRTLFFGRVMMFLGVNPMDSSVRQHLDAVREEGASGAPMFWITDRRDREACEFVQKYGIKQIFYSPADNHHELCEVLDLLSKSESFDETLTRPGFSNIPKITSSIRNLDAKDFSSMTSDEIRNLLNKKACDILRSGTEEGYKEYEKFLQTYSREIHNCWYLARGEKLLGLTIEEEIDDGAFGRVFRATNQRGECLAVKLLKCDLMRKPECVQSFRRGVRAMEILAKERLPGVVQYKFASEIPAFVAMEFVEGENLQTITEKRLLGSWKEKMKVLTETAKIIKSAHSLPQRVLHRDIRPQNIMLKGYDYSSDDWSVCVLDFDLAFHKGANEISMQMSSGMNGYLAPEQTDRSGKFGTTRSSRVDSYGFAMLCYFVITGIAPRPEQCFQEGWEQKVVNTVCSQKCDEWISLPYEMARIITCCTKREQNARMDLYKVYEYLEILRGALMQNRPVLLPELLVDELACLIAKMMGYENQIFIDGAGHRELQCLDGQRFHFVCEDEHISVETSWHNTGTVEFAKIKKLLKERADALASRLQKAAFKAVACRMEGTGVTVELRLNFHECLHERMEALARILSKHPIHHLSF